MPPGASCAHAGMSESLRPVRTATVTMLGRAGAASAGRGPAWVDASTAGSRAAWAGATATAGVWAAALATAAEQDGSGDGANQDGRDQAHRADRAPPRRAGAASVGVGSLGGGQDRLDEHVAHEQQPQSPGDDGEQAEDLPVV